MKTSEVQNLKIKGCISLDNLCVMDIKGEDAKVKEFLQGQIATDIKKIDEEENLFTKLQKQNS